MLEKKKKNTAAKHSGCGGGVLRTKYDDTIRQNVMSERDDAMTQCLSYRPIAVKKHLTKATEGKEGSRV